MKVYHRIQQRVSNIEAALELLRKTVFELSNPLPPEKPESALDTIPDACYASSMENVEQRLSEAHKHIVLLRDELIRVISMEDDGPEEQMEYKIPNEKRAML